MISESARSESCPKEQSLTEVFTHQRNYVWGGFDLPIAISHSEEKLTSGAQTQNSKAEKRDTHLALSLFLEWLTLTVPVVFSLPIEIHLLPIHHPLSQPSTFLKSFKKLPLCLMKDNDQIPGISILELLILSGEMLSWAQLSTEQSAHRCWLATCKPHIRHICLFPRC